MRLLRVLLAAVVLISVPLHAFSHGSRQNDACALAQIQDASAPANAAPATVAAVFESERIHIPVFERVLTPRSGAAPRAPPAP